MYNKISATYQPLTDIKSGLSADAAARDATDRAPARGEAREKATLVSSPISQTEQTEHLQIYPQTIKVKRPFKGEKPTPPERTGSQIQGFSDKSRGRLRFTSTNARDKIFSQFCMTYHNYWPIDGRQFKRHLNAFLTRCRKHFPFFEYIWVAEFQTRGAPHVHLYSNLPVEPETHDTLVRFWVDIAEKGNTAMVKVHKNPEQFKAWKMGTGSYLCKYLDKTHQKFIPKGFYNFGRWWGNSRGIVPEPQTVTKEEISQEFQDVNEETGEIYEGTEPYKFLIRTLGKYHEKINRRSWFRRTNRSTSVLTGAPIFMQTLEYLYRSRSMRMPESPPF